MRKDDLELCGKLKRSDSVRRVTIQGLAYGMYVIERGERLYYEKEGRALICEISARNAMLNEGSVREWDDGEKISAEVRTSVVAEMVPVYKALYLDDLEVVGR